MNEDRVYVLDGAADSLLRTVAVGDSPVALCWNSTDNLLYCANAGSYTVSVIDPVADSVLVEVAVGTRPVALCHDPLDDKVYCANSGGTNLTVLDGATGRWLATVPVAAGPTRLLYNPLNNKVYCASAGGGGTVTAIHARLDSVTAVVPVGAGPVALCANPLQNRVYCANALSSSLSILRDSMTGVTETVNDQRGVMNRRATLIGKALNLTPNISNLTSDIVLLDAAGRRVLSLAPGRNDVSRLASGVYFVMRNASSGQAVEGSSEKVVVTR
jgi:YVTN family beta-propeller protein